jgi:hypothetical protein
MSDIGFPKSGYFYASRIVFITQVSERERYRREALSTRRAIFSGLNITQVSVVRKEVGR